MPFSSRSNVWDCPPAMLVDRRGELAINHIKNMNNIFVIFFMKKKLFYKLDYFKPNTLDLQIS
jgi:hypothetical protein